MANEIEITIKSKDQTNLDKTLSKTRGESDKLKTSLDGVGKTDWDAPTAGASKFKGALLDVGKAAGGFLAANVVAVGAEKVLGFMTDGIGLATDLGEALSKSNQVFGQSGAAIEDWAGKAADSLGMSKREALMAAGDFGNLFDMMGVGDEAAADMSKSLIQAAVDLGSFNNADATEVIESMTSAFRGEYDSIQKFLPSINAANVEQKALAMTGKTATDQLTEQDKMLAIVTMTTQELGKAQGDFALTADGAANAQKRANAELENAQTALGEQLLPLQMKFIELQSQFASVLTEEVIPRLIEFKGWLKENEETVKAVAIVLGVLLAAALVVCIVLLVAISVPIILLIKLCQTLAPIVSDLAGRFMSFFNSVTALLADNLGRIQGWRDGMFNAFSNVGATIEGWKNGAISALNQLASAVGSLPGRIASAASGMWNSIQDGFRSMINTIIGWWNRLSFSTPSIKIDGPTIFGQKMPGVNIGSRTFSVPQIGKLRSGGTRSGLSLVGEAGPELVDMGAGGHVIGAGRTAAMLNGAGATGATVINIYVEGSIRSDRDLVKLLTKEIDQGSIPGLSRSTA